MGKPQVFPFKPDLISDVVLFFYCSISFCGLVDHISGYGMVFHQIFDPFFSGFII
jgi:hypothetical protein